MGKVSFRDQPGSLSVTKKTESPSRKRLDEIHEKRVKIVTGEVELYQKELEQQKALLKRAQEMNDDPLYLVGMGFFIIFTLFSIFFFKVSWRYQFNLKTILLIVCIVIGLMGTMLVALIRNDAEQRVLSARRGIESAKKKLAYAKKRKREVKNNF